MTPRKISSSTTKAQRDDLDVLSPLLDLARDEAPTEMDVARLRRRVRGALRSEAPPRSRFTVLRGLAAACSLIVVVGSLYFVAGPSFDPLSFQPQTTGVTDDAGLRIQMERDDSGAVHFRIEGSAGHHRIAKSSSPKPDAPADVRIVRDGRFVDGSESLEPGSMVFYRID